LEERVLNYDLIEFEECLMAKLLKDFRYT